MNIETSIPIKRQNGSLRKTQHALLGLRTLQTEVRTLKLQIAQMEAALETRQAAETYRVPQSLSELKPRRQPPLGKTAMQMIQGQWPGEETTEQLLAQLKALG